MNAQTRPENHALPALLASARAAGAAGTNWMTWTASDEVTAACEGPDAPHGRDFRDLKKAYQEGVREGRLAGGWLVRWTTAPADYDSFGTETIPAADGAAGMGDYHGKDLRRVMMDPRHASYQADRYSSGLHPTWEEDPRIADARVAARIAARIAADKADREAREEKRAVRAEQDKRAKALEETTRAAEWERCIAIVPEGSTIVDPGADAVRGRWGVIPGRDPHVYYSVRIVRGWPDTAEQANVMGEGALNGNSPGSPNAGSLAHVAHMLAYDATSPESHPGQKRWRIVSPGEVPPRPVLERIGHDRLTSIRRCEAAGRIVWVGRPRFASEALVLDEQGHKVRARKVLEALQTSGVARDL